MSSAPFPTEANAVEGDIQQEARWVVAADRRRGVIPSFYRGHSDLSMTVRSYEGAPLLSVAGKTFTLGEVMVERRWAIDEEGKCLRQDIFQNLMRRVYEETYALVAKDAGPGNKPQTPPLEYESYPRVEAWVEKMPDPQDPSKTVPMHYNPHPKDAKPAEFFYDQDGNQIDGSRMEHLVEAYKSPTLRKILKPSEVAEVEAFLGSTPSREKELEEQIRKLEERLNEVLVGGGDEEEPEPAFAGEAPCGKTLTATSEKRLSHSISMHKRFCKLDGCISQGTTEE